MTRPPENSKSRQWVWAALLVVVVVMAYLPVLRAGLIWDDDQYVVKNDTLRTVAGLYAIWFHIGAVPQYYPLVHTVFWLEYHLWGLNPLGFHLVEVLLHGLGAILLWRLLSKLEIKGALVAATIFALHPVEVESVAWVTELKNVLSAVCYFSAALCYLRFNELRGGGADKRLQKWYGMALLLFMAALWSKTVTCSLPAALLIVLWWKQGSLKKKDVWPLVPFFVVGTGMGMLTAWMEKHTVGASGAAWTLSIFDRCLIAGRALWFYAGKLVWPANLTFTYPRWTIDAASWSQWLFPAAAVGVVVWLWALRKRIGRGPLAAVLFFIVTLFPALGFINVYPFRYSFVADHFQYLASIGLIVLAASGLTRLAISKGLSLQLFKAGCLGLLIILFFLTQKQTRIYHDLETLWRDTLVKSPNSWLASNNLGALLYEEGHDEEAIRMLTKCLALGEKTDEAKVHDNLGNALLRNRQVSEAILQFQSALEIEPQNAKMHRNYGTALLRAGRTDEAIAELNKSLKLDPNDPEANNNMGVALLKLGELDAAKICFARGVSLDPGYADAHYNLGSVLESEHQLEAAANEYARAIEIKPDYVDACFSLGKLLAGQHQITNAIIYFTRTVELMPDYAEAQNNLANMLVAEGRLDEAIEHFARAVALKPDNAEAQYNFGATLMFHGDLTNAISHYERAVALKPAVAPFHYRLGLALQKNKNFSGAIGQFQEALKLDPAYWAAANSLARLLATCPDGSLRDGRRAVELAQQASGSPNGGTPEFLDTLAAAYAEAGDFTRAMTTVKRAVELATDQNKAALVESLQSREQLYEAQVAYHEKP